MSVGAASVPAMPSHLHEVLIEMFRDRPALAAEVLAGPLGIPLPAFEEACLVPSDLNDTNPTEYRADAMVTLTVRKNPVLAVVIEAQLDTKKDKRRSWPVYVATAYARLGCPVVLLAICPGRAAARHWAKPIVVGYPTLVLTPLVLGPENVPVVNDADLARRNPELAVLSAMVHGARPDQAGMYQPGIFEAMLAGLDVVDEKHAKLYADIVLMVLPAAARSCLEALMTTPTTFEYQSDFARRYYGQGEARGKAEGEAQAVLTFLDARGFEVPDHVRERIAGCTDLDQLDTWVRRAATATKVDDLFD
jgi:hypothetical protein